MVLRNIFRVPMSAFDHYRHFANSHARLVNFFMMQTMLFFVLFSGKGVEKLAMSGSASSYEFKRRMHRFFMPYCLVSYKRDFK